MSSRGPQLYTIKSDGYYPFDEMLHVPRFRILRALTHFDLASADDLSIALDLEDGKRAANALHTTLTRMHKERLLDRDGAPHYYRYRINTRGRRQLKKLIRRGAIATLKRKARA